MSNVVTSETFDDIDNAVREERDIETKDSLTLTQSIKRMLYSPADDYGLHTAAAVVDWPEYESIFEIARARGMSVKEFVFEDPALALKMAENSCAVWQNLLTTAAVKGSLPMMVDGVEQEFTVTRNQTRLIEVRVKEANAQLAYVNELTLMAYTDGVQRKDALERSMYRRALNGDSRLAMYLYDRVEGRPAETRTQELDYDNAYNIYAILKTLFKEQLEVLNSGSGTRLVCCSRRAGKTHLLVGILLIECLRHPRTKCMYIGETMELSEGLINKAANDIIDMAGLKDKRGRRFNWKKIDNGSEIMIRGLSNTKDPDQIRGNTCKVIVIDEFFHLKSELLEYMVREVLEPMQLDFADDYMFICAGTPPRVKGTYGEYVWKNWEVPHFSWTWRDNPHPVSVEARQEYVENKLREKGLDWSSSYARREYNAEWAYDDDLLLIPEFHSYDRHDVMPNIIPTRILFGIDYGVGDNDTIWGCVWNDDDRRGYQFWEDKFNRLDIAHRGISQLEYLAEQVRAAWRTALDYFPQLSPREANKRILWDADDSDQHLTDYFNVSIRLNDTGFEDLRLNIQNAHKTDRTMMYDKMRDLFRTGDMLVMKNSKFEHELVSTICRRGPNGEVYTEIDDKAYHPDLIPAARYALWNAIGV